MGKGTFKIYICKQTFFVWKKYIRCMANQLIF